jgi:hypothetical protein
MQWYYAKNNARLGPLDTSAMLQLIAAGQLQPSDQVWRDGLPAWTAAANCPELFRQSAPPPLSPPGFTPTPALAAPITGSAAQIFMMIAGALLLVTFFTPYFYCSITRPATTLYGTSTPSETMSSFMWGWHLWWGILAMIAGTLALIAAIFNLALKRSPVAFTTTKWIAAGLFSIATIVTLLGIILGIFGVGMEVTISNQFLGEVRVSFSQIRESVNAMGNFGQRSAPSLVAFPITSILAFLAAALGALFALIAKRTRS